MTRLLAIAALLVAGVVLAARSARPAPDAVPLPESDEDGLFVPMTAWTPAPEGYRWVVTMNLTK